MRIRPLRVAMIAALVAGALLAPATAGAAPPTNDDFANATVIDPSSLPITTDAVPIDEATLQIGAGEGVPCGLAGSDAQTIWYAITPTTSGVLRVSDSATFYYQFLGVYRQDGAGLAGLVNLACATWYYGQNSTSFSVEAGKTYYIQAGSSFTSSGSVTLTLQVVPPPTNDDFADATSITSLVFSDSVDSTAAGFELNEPTPSCGSMEGTVWYAFTPSTGGSYTASLPYTGLYAGVAAYSGSGLGSLTEIGCRAVGQVLTFHANAGTTYYFQVGGFGDGRGTLSFQLDVAQPPSASFIYFPVDPTPYDTVQFYDQSFDPGGSGFSSEVWDFGDGTRVTDPGCCPTHRYAVDGTYKVKLTVATTDGRTASTSQDVVVKTHDVTIAKVTVPQTASVGQTRTIAVGLTNSRYVETVQVQLLKSVNGGGWQQVGVLTQYVPVRGANRTTNFSFNYTFAPEDALLGKVNFQAVATIQGARDAIPTDNTFISLPTKVNG
jgi:PKD repeat protein